MPSDSGGSLNGGIAATSFTLEHDAWGRLVLTEPSGRQHVGVEAARAFPLSAPNRGISLTDSEGRELVWIGELESLPPGTRLKLEEHLQRRVFVPVIRRVLSISAAVEPSEWQVDTDRGRTRFTLKSEDDVQYPSDHAALVTDVHGIRYLIPDVRQLDAASRGWVERFLSDR